MSVTVTEKVSYGSRIGASFKGVIPGIVMFVAAFPLLFWNEGRAVKTARALDEGQGAVIEVGSNATVDSENEGRLVHMSGLADTGDVLEDPEFGVSENCIRLDRSVEIYQWVEHAKTEEKKGCGSVNIALAAFVAFVASVKNALQKSPQPFVLRINAETKQMKLIKSLAWLNAQLDSRDSIPSVQAVAIIMIRQSDCRKALRLFSQF